MIKQYTFISTYFEPCCCCSSVTRLSLSCNPIDCSPPGSSVHGISQASILEWVAIPFSRDLPNKRNESASVAWQADSLPLSHQYIYKVKVKVKSLSRVRLCDSMDCSLPGSSVLQAIVREWIAISFSRGSSQPRDQNQVSRSVDRRFTI